MQSGRLLLRGVRHSPGRDAARHNPAQPETHCAHCNSSLALLPCCVHCRQQSAAVTYVLEIYNTEHHAIETVVLGSGLMNLTPERSNSITETSTYLATATPKHVCLTPSQRGCGTINPSCACAYGMRSRHTKRAQRHRAKDDMRPQARHAPAFPSTIQLTLTRKQSSTPTLDKGAPL